MKNVSSDPPTPSPGRSRSASSDAHGLLRKGSSARLGTQDDPATLESSRISGRDRDSSRGRESSRADSSRSLLGNTSQPQSPARSINPEITVAKSLNDATKALEKRVDKEVKDSRSHLKNVFSSLQTGEYTGDIEFRLKAYLRYKSDARSMLTFFRDVVLPSYPDLDRSILGKLDLELAAFEKSFDSFEELGKNTRHSLFVDVNSVMTPV
jgi:hypothetical protein